jgi:Protein of unknown function (DUF1552)
MYITRRSLPRRTFLRGIGATMALPLLDAMVPAMAAAANTVAAQSRFGFVYIPHGVILDQFLPTTEGADFEYRPIMKPLEAFRSETTLISNLAGPPDGGSGHVGAGAAWLTGASAKRTEAEDVRLGMSVDQHIAKSIASRTPLPSLELTTEDLSGLIGSCDYGFSCTYLNTICWSTPTTPLPMEINPRVVFERLFGDAKSQEHRLANMRADRSILDSIREDETRLKGGLGAGDRARITDYLDNIREIERRIQAAETQAATSVAAPEAPVGVPESYDDHVGLMFELMVIAYQSELTRVATFMLGRELTNRTYPQIGVPDPHHAVSHHQNSAESMVKHAKINTHHLTLFARFLERMRDTPDGDGSLLDHSMLVYGSGMADGNLHSHNPLWLLLTGGANGLRGNRHMKAAAGTPLGNALVGIAARAGVEVDQIGHSNGRFDI